MFLITFENITNMLFCCTYSAILRLDCKYNLDNLINQIMLTLVIPRYVNAYVKPNICKIIM